MRWIITLLFLSSLQPINAQETDSLKQLLQTGLNDSSRLEVLYALFQETIYTDTLEGFQYLGEARELAIKNKWWDKLHRTTGGRVIYYYRIGQFEKCTGILEADLKIYEENNSKQGIGDVKSAMGNIFYGQSAFQKALESYHLALEMYREVKDTLGTSKMLNNIGGIYYSLKSYDKALDYYNESAIIKGFIGDIKGLISNNQNMALIYDSWDQYDEALKYSNQAKRLADSIGHENYNQYSELLYNIASIHLNRGNPDQAFPFLEQSMEIAKSENDSVVIANVHLYQGDYYRAKGDKLKAEKEYGTAVGIFERRGIHRRTYETYYALALLKAELNKFKEAYGAHFSYAIYRDSVLNEESQKAITEMETRYQTDLKDLEIANLNKDQLLTQLELDQERIEGQNERNKNWIYGGGLVAALILGGMAVVGFVMKRKDNRIIQHQKLEVEEKNRDILDSINYAKRIQEAILPPRKLVKQYLENSFILYKPKDIVAGDFYWMETVGDMVIFAAADCTGHGVPGAMVSVVCHNAMNRAVREFALTDPGQILDKTRELVIRTFEKSEEDVKDGMDIALCALKGDSLHYAGAHNPLWIVRKGEIIETKATKQPVGVVDNPTPFTTHRFKLLTGDCIYIFSDGYVDQFGGEKGKKFKSQAFRRLLLSIQDQPMDEQRIIINQTFESWRGDLEQVDDVCVIGVKV